MGSTIIPGTPFRNTQGTDIVCVVNKLNTFLMYVYLILSQESQANYRGQLTSIIKNWIIV